jgi:hypothetical protein
MKSTGSAIGKHSGFRSLSFVAVVSKLNGLSSSGSVPDTLGSRPLESLLV